MASNLPSSGVALVAQNAGQFLNAMSDASNALGSFGKGAGAMSEIVTGALRRVGEFVTEMAADAARAVGTWLKDSVGVAGDFEQTLNVLGATSGATAADLGRVAEKAKELGADMTLPATSAQDAAEVMLELSKAGFSVQESMDAAKGALQLSSAAQVDAATAASITAGAINAFGLEASDAVRIADLLAAGANASSASMTDLSQGLQQAGFAFHTAGMPVEDLVTSLAALTNVGLTGSDAGTALKNALMRLMDPTDKAAKLMADLGFSAYDANGKMKPLPTLIADLNKALAGMTPEQRNAALGNIFLSDGMKAMIPLLDLGKDGFLKLKDSVTEQGAAADVAAAQMNGWNGGVAAVKSQMETLQLTVGTFIKDALTPLLFKIAEFIPKAGAFIEQLLGIAQGAAKSNDPIKFLLSALALLNPSLIGIVTALLRVYAALAPLIAAFSDGSVSSQDLALAFGLVRDAVGRVGEVFQSVGQRIIAALPDIIQSVGAIATEIITTIGEELPGIIDGLSQWRMAFLNSITAKLPEIISSVGTVASNIVTAVGNALPGIIDALGRWGFAFLDWLLQTSPNLMASLVETGLKVVEAIGNAIPGIVESLAQWGAKFVDWLIEAIPKLFATLTDLNAKILSWIVEKAPGILEQLAEWGGRFVLWVVQTVPKLLVALGEMLADLVRWVVEHRQDIANAVIKWGEAFVNWVSETAIPGITRALSNLWGQLSGWIKETAGKISADGSVGRAIVDGIRAGINKAWEGLKSWLMGLVQGLMDAAADAIGAHSPSRMAADKVGSPIPQGIAMGIDQDNRLVRKSMKGLADDLTTQAARMLAPALQSPIALPVASGGNTTTSTTYGPSYSMPVYTNMTQSALSQGLALIEAMSR